MNTIRRIIHVGWDQLAQRAQAHHSGCTASEPAWWACASRSTTTQSAVWFESVFRKRSRIVVVGLLVPPYISVNHPGQVESQAA